jgi:hypothetical protein
VTLDPATRLAALHSLDFNEAIAIRLPETETGPGWDPHVIVENAIEAFLDDIEAVLCNGEEQITLDVERAELIAIALITRKRAARSPRQTSDQRARRAGLIALGLRLKESLRRSGVPAGEAEIQAATMVAEIGGKYGDVASPSTFRKLMKSRGKKLY